MTHSEEETPETINLQEYANDTCSEETAELVSDTLGADCEKIVALALHLQIDFEEAQSIEISSYDDCVLEYGSQEYLVCTDSEADDKWNEYLDSYIDDCVLPEIPEAYRNYFDDDKFKNDCKFDGRGHSLSGYDGSEDEETVLGTTYYIYRQN